MGYQNYFVYILTNSERHTVLYIGVTNSLERRVSEHSLGLGSRFARQYNAHKLIYYEASRSNQCDSEREAAEEVESGEKGNAHQQTKSALARFI
jgi:putative endonuclease